MFEAYSLHLRGFLAAFRVADDLLQTLMGSNVPSELSGTISMIVI